MCVVIPTYNNAGTVVGVVERTLPWCSDVLVVNDGSTDGTASLLATLPGITVLTLSRNSGKGMALRRGFEEAQSQGFEYAVTIDADGQHYPEDLPAFVEAMKRHPGALLVGSRGFDHEQMPGKSKFANRFSNFWFRLQTGIDLPDTQTGFRMYPLARLRGLRWITSRYESELELLVWQAWGGVELHPVPIRVFYPHPSERVTHFRPVADFMRITALNTVLTSLTVFMRPKLRAWVLTLVLMALACLSLSRISYEEDINAFLPHDEMSERYADVYGHICGGNRILVTLDGACIDTLLAAIEEFQDAMPGRVCRATDDEMALELMDFVRSHAPSLLLEEDYRRMDSLLNVRGWADSCMARCRNLLQTPMGSMTVPMLQADPLFLFTPITDRLNRERGSTAFKTIDGWIVGKDERLAMFWIESPYGASETLGNALLADSISHVADSIMSLHDGLSIAAIGAPVIAVDNARQIRADGMLAVTLSAVLIVALLLIRFRSVAPLAWSLLSIAFGWVMALGTMAMFVPQVSLIVLGVGSVVIGLAVDYPLHYISHLSHCATPQQAVRELSRPMLTGCVTTIGSFLCLLLLKSEALHHFGIFASLMLGFTLLFSLTMLPRLCTRSRLSQQTSAEAGSWKPWRFPVFPMFCVATVILWLAARGTNFDSDLMHINYMTDVQRRGMARLDSLRPDRAADGMTMLFAVAEGRDAEDALANNDRLMRRLGTVCAWLPGRVEQRQRIERWQHFWDGRREDVMAQLHDAARRSGFRPEAFAAFEDAIAMEPEMLTADDFGIMMRTVCAANVWRNDTLCRITSFFPVDSVPAGIREQNSPQAYMFTASDVSSALASLLNDNFNMVGLVCSLMVFGFLWLSFRRLEWAFVAFLPLAVSWVWILGLMNLLGLRFNIVNVILATFIFGQGADYAIFVTDGLLTRYRTSRDTLTGYRQAIRLLALTTLSGIGTLVVARHPALHSLGVVALLGMVVVVTLCLYLPPLVFGWMTRGREEPVTLMRLLRSLYAMTVFLLGIPMIWPVLLWMRYVGRGDEEHRMCFHKMLCAISRFVIKHVPGTGYTCQNLCGEDFGKPAIIVCNHQSHLDLMAILALTPRLIVLTKDWVWNNPFYGSFIHFAEYYPMSRGVDEVMEHVRDAMARGYSVVVFPEGTRSADRHIGRFHKGAFHLATELGCDIVEVMIHGFGYVLPKTDFMLRKGGMGLRVLRRFTPDCNDARELTRSEHLRYVEIYEEWCNEKGYR